MALPEVCLLPNALKIKLEGDILMVSFTACFKKIHCVELSQLQTRKCNLPPPTLLVNNTDMYPLSIPTI